MSRIYPTSINTLRIDTVRNLKTGVITVWPSMMRMGVDGRHIDNLSQGGVACGINRDGCLKKWAYNKNAERCDKHPQGFVFEGFRVPSYEKALSLVRVLAPRFISVSKLQSWDIAIKDNGEPTVIETNLSYGEVDFLQLCNGPVLGDLTEEVLDFLVDNNPFLRQ